MQATNTTRRFQAHTSTQGSTDATPAFVYLYSQEIDPNSIKFCTRLGKKSRLNASVVEFDTAKTAIASVSEQLGLCKDKSNHLLLNIHGHSTGKKGNRSHRFVAGIGTYTERDQSTRHWLENLLCRSAKIFTPKALPFIHILSCEAKALSDEIIPGSKLWKSSWFVLYSSSKITSINHFGNSLEVMSSYVELCESHDREVDPFTLFYLAGLARGDCITLLGGDLQQPLTLHAPKSLRDLEHAHSIKLLEGSALDKARLLLAGIELSPKERSLLPDPHDDYLKRELLAARVERNDMIAVKRIIKTHPQLPNKPQSLGTLHLASAVKNYSLDMITWMLNHGVDINASDVDGDTVLFNAISNDDIVILEFLLKRKANPNCTNHQMVTPLLVAVENDRVKAAELLINYGADITWEDEGDTALTLAVSKGQLSVVHCLLQHGADHRTGLSTELVQQARAAGRADIALVLEQALAKTTAWKKYNQ